MTEPVSNKSISELILETDLGPTSSIQLKFAALQLAQAMLSKNAANEYMGQIEKIQEEQKKSAEMIAKARDLQNQAKTGDKATEMPADMIQFFKDRGLSWDKTGDDNFHNKDEWEYNIQSLTNYQESISNKTQTLMVYLQDFIGQYNSYTQGASSQVSQAMQTLQAIATAR